MRTKGFSHASIEAALQKENRLRCEPPLEEDEVRKIADSISRYQPARISLLPVGREFHPKPYVEALKKEAPMIAYGGRIHKYANGVYPVWPKEEIDQRVLQLNDMVRPRNLEEIQKMLETTCYVRPERVNQPGLLNLKNGILDPQTGELDRHSYEQYMTTQIPVEWDRQAECPEFDGFLETVLQDQDSITLLWQMFGYALTPDTRFQKAFILYGEGSNGKSVCTEVLEALLGPNCSAIGLNQLKHPYDLAELLNKTANLTTEINVKEFVDDEIFKKLISGDPIQAQRKYKDPFKFRSMAKFIITANKLPNTHDRSHAFFRRVIIICFDVIIPDENQDKNLAKRIIQNELPGILRRSIDGLKKLYRG